MKENVYQEDAVIPFEPNFDKSETNCSPVIPMSQNVIQNQMKQAANMFQGATFNNCTSSTSKCQSKNCDKMTIYEFKKYVSIF